MSVNRVPTGRTGHVAVSYKEYIFIWGGYKENEHYQVNSYFFPWDLSVYCAVTEKWNSKSCCVKDGPPLMSGSTATLLNGYMYLFGGYRKEPEEPSNHLYRLCLESLVWERLHPSGPSPFPVDKTASWQHGEKLYIFGGFGSPTSINALNCSFQFVFDLSGDLGKGWTNQFYQYDPEKNEWCVPNFLGDLPLPRAAHAAAVVNNKVYIFGGRHNRRRMNDLHCLNMLNMSWSGEITIQGPVPEGRSWHSFTTLSDTFILLYGGFSHDNRALSDCWLLNTRLLTWQPVCLPFNKPRLWHSASLTIYNEVMIFGGCASNILDVENRMQQANDIIFIRLTPKSLLRLCLDRVGELLELEPQLCTLPHSLQTILNLRYCSSKPDSWLGW